MFVAYNSGSKAQENEVQEGFEHLWIQKSWWLMCIFKVLGHFHNNNIITTLVKPN